jgi:hypothetical protein
MQVIPRQTVVNAILLPEGSQFFDTIGNIKIY